MAPKEKIDGERISEMASAYRQSQVIIAAAGLGLFDALGRGRRSAEELAADSGADPRGLTILLRALCALGLLEKSPDEGFAISPGLERFLLTSSRESLIPSIKLNGILYESWGQLSERARGRGSPTLPPEGRGSEESSPFDSDFAEAMASISAKMAPDVADAVDISQARSMLDVGAGPGIYSIAFLKRNPGLSSTLIDNQTTLEVARKYAEREGLLERVSFIDADIFDLETEEGFDFVFASNFIHMFSEDRNRILIRKFAQLLNPHGTVCIKDFLLDDDRVSPTGSALFAVNMLVNTRGGNCYTLADIESWISEAGLSFAESIEVGRQSALVLARRPTT